MDWDERYQAEIGKPMRQPRKWLIDHQSLLPRNGWALDAAMGLGNNSGYLIEKGMQVLGIDRSNVAVRFAKKSYPSLHAVLADVPACRFPIESFDLISNFYYLDRSMIPKYLRWLKPGGIILFETLTLDIRSICPDISPEKLLQPGELLFLFSGWAVLDYHEGWVKSDHQKDKAVASIAAKKPLE